MNNPFDEVRSQVLLARQQLHAADSVAFNMADLLVGRMFFRASKNALSIKNRSAASYFFAQGTKALRIAQRASLRIGA